MGIVYMNLTSESYKVTWQYKVSSYTYQKSFKSKDEAIDFINTDEDLDSAINVKLYHVKTTEEEISFNTESSEKTVNYPVHYMDIEVYPKSGNIRKQIEGLK
jgi:hypothetical protein